MSFKLALAAAAWAALFGCRENTFDIIIIAALSFMAFAAFALGSPVRWERLEELHDAVRARAIAAVVSRFSERTGLVSVGVYSAERKQVWLCLVPPTDAAELSRLRPTSALHIACRGATGLRAMPGIVGRWLTGRTMR